jgi:hypothetical protein
MRSAGRLATLAACALALGSCGGGGDGKGAAGERSALELQPPEAPPPGRCSERRLATRRAPDASLRPAPGRYRYRVNGTRTIAEKKRRTARLGSPMTLTATPATRVGRLVCFRLQRRYTPTLGETATFVVRGSTLYMTELELQAGGQRTTIRPEPPVVALAPSELEWSGAFQGETRGRYSAQVVGRRTFRTGGSTERAVGVEFRLSAAGAVKGQERSVRWFAVERGLVLAERVEQSRRLGLDETKLKYSARLTGGGR